jgi:phosphatidate cytidylyltransferase
MAVAYIGLTGACLGWLRTMPAENVDGIKIVLHFLTSIWVGDSGAYYVGKNLGQHRMSPKISPKKTWEGLTGGVVATFLAGAAFHLLFELPFDWPHVFAIAAILAVTAPIGDLVVSLFKRDTGTKDSSNLIPGHGGLLDRTDSLVFAAPFVLLYLHLVGFIG